VKSVIRKKLDKRRRLFTALCYWVFGSDYDFAVFFSRVAADESCEVGERLILNTRLQTAVTSAPG
jgi:hypothetical protein